MVQTKQTAMAFGRSLFITGANRGIGLEIVTQLARHQNRPKLIFASCRSPDAATELKKIAAANENVHIIKLDIGNFEDISNAYAAIKEHVKDEGLDVLINNAGILEREDKIEHLDPERMIEHYRVNAVAPAMVIKEFLPLLRQASQNNSSLPMGCSRAAILNMSTKVASFDDNKSGRIYSYRCSKVALNMVTKNLSIELKDDKILAVSLHPGWVQTDMGGKNASTTTGDCVNGLLRVIEGLTEKDNGLFYDFKGNLIPW